MENHVESIEAGAADDGAIPIDLAKTSGPSPNGIETDQGTTTDGAINNQPVERKAYTSLADLHDRELATLETTNAARAAEAIAAESVIRDSILRACVAIGEARRLVTAWKSEGREGEFSGDALDGFDVRAALFNFNLATGVDAEEFERDHFGAAGEVRS